MMDVLRAFPIVAKLETEMFHRLLKAGVRREEDGTTGHFQAVFVVSI
jgi:hypothetical protein